MKKSAKRRIILIVVVVIVALAWFIRKQPRPEEIIISPEVAEIVQREPVVIDEPIDDEPAVEEDTSDDQPVVVEDSSDDQPIVADDKLEKTTMVVDGEHVIAAPFIVQAPFADWSERYKETCEEASVLIVHNFYRGLTELSQQQMKDKIDELTDWGDEHFAGAFDTNITETAEYFTDYLEYDPARVRVVKDITIDDIKAVLAQGYPVIVPAAGRELGNKYFQTPGPLYHMLVIVGYDQDEFITNDPGTRRGEGYRYQQEVLYNAIHDWTGDYDTILSGQKVMLVVTS